MYLLFALVIFEVSFILSNLSGAFSGGVAPAFDISRIFLVLPLGNSVDFGNVFLISYAAFGNRLPEPDACVLPKKLTVAHSRCHLVVLDDACVSLQVVPFNDPRIMKQSFPAKLALVEIPDSRILERVQPGALMEEGEMATRNVPQELIPRAGSVTASDATKPALVGVDDVVLSASLLLAVFDDAPLVVHSPRVKTDQIVILKFISIQTESCVERKMMKIKG